MSSFATSFWGGSDYAAGLGVLFGKLQQGVQENQQMLTISRMRAEAEDMYGQRLGDIEPATNRIEGGFQKDDGASTKKAYEGVRAEMIEASRNHRKIASNIRELVVSPFSRWCDAHAARVQNSQDDLQARIKAHDRQADNVRSLRSQYYNKCRRVEDLDEEEQLAFQDPQKEGISPKIAPTIPTVKLSEPEQDEDEEPIEIGDESFMPEQVKKILTHMLDNIKLGETKVPILGTYQNVSTGAEITEYIQQHLGGTSISYAERIGQDLIGHGFLRLIGNVGNAFANSSRMYYQWRPKAFQLTGLPEKKKPLGRTSTASSQEGLSLDSPVVGAVSEYLAGWNPLNNTHPNETPAEKLRREARESDERYKVAVRKLDALRCNLEEAMIDHLKFMERCELDRLKAIKSVILDFSGAISNVIPSLQSTVDNMMLFQETVQPLGDLRYFLENYRTGQFVPRVQTYENYYNQVDDQIYGVDIEARARADRKRVPLIVTTLLTFMDNHYPDLEGDEARQKVWLVDVPLAATHHLRAAINNGKSISYETLERYEVPIVASALKLYFMELPDSLVSSTVYEIIKTIYTTTAPNSSEATRISVIQSTLGQLRLANIATLDAITTHFTRLIDLTSAEEPYVAELASKLAPCILRPKQESALSMTEKFNVRLLRDLFAHKDAIFGELKRAASLSQTKPESNRPRAISTNESRRREHMEERQRAILAAGSQRTRAPSPNRPGYPHGLASAHRRDRSTSAETRFPIATASAQASPVVDRMKRGSLDVPQSPAGLPPQSPPKMNGTSHIEEHAPRPPQIEDTPQQSDGSQRGRSDTQGTATTAPITSASLSQSGDYTTPANYYTPSRDTPTDIEADSGAAAPSFTSVRSSVEVEKRNSLNRNSAGGAPTSRFSRKAPPGGLHRQSLISGSSASAGNGYSDQHQRDSVGSVGSSIVGDYLQSPIDIGASESFGAGAGAGASVGAGAGAGAAGAGQARGVELVDRPMDD